MTNDPTPHQELDTLKAEIDDLTKLFQRLDNEQDGGYSMMYQRGFQDGMTAAQKHMEFRLKGIKDE